MEKQALIENLEYLQETKEIIKQAIKNKGVAVEDTDTFRSYADKIENIYTPNIQEYKETNASTEDVYVNSDEGYEAIRTVKVKAVDNSIDENIKAENIKQGVSILGVEGNYEGGGGTPVKSNIYKVATIEERDAITDMVEGDMCVVHSLSIENVKVNSKFQIATFPDTVVLDTAITDHIDISYRAVDNSVMFDCFGNLDSSRFMMDCFTESGNIRIEYTSEDGITYTRTDTTGNPVDFGTEIYYAYTEMWNDAIGHFIHIEDLNFPGIFTYEEKSTNIRRAKDLNGNDIMIDFNVSEKMFMHSRVTHLIYNLIKDSNGIIIEYDALKCLTWTNNNKYDTVYYYLDSEGNIRRSTDGTTEQLDIEISHYTKDNIDMTLLPWKDYVDSIIIPASELTDAALIYDNSYKADIKDVNGNTLYEPSIVSKDTISLGFNWYYSNIGINTEESQVLKGNKLYGNSGILVGTRDLNKYLERFYIISEQEPEDKSLMWIQLKDGFYNDNYLGYNLTDGTNRKMFFSTKDTSDTNVIEGISKIPVSQGNNLMFQRGKYVFYYKRQTNTTLCNQLYRLNLVTGENILWATHPNNYYNVLKGAYDGVKYLYVMDGSNADRTSHGTAIWKLDLDTKEWTQIATTPVTFKTNSSNYFGYDPLNNILHVGGGYGSGWRYYKYNLTSSSWSSYTTEAEFPLTHAEVTYIIYEDSDTKVFIGTSRPFPYVCTKGSNFIQKDFKFRTPTGVVNVTPSVVCPCGEGFITKIGRTLYYTEFEYDKTSGETYVTVSRALSLTAFSSFGTDNFYGYLDSETNTLYFQTYKIPQGLYGKITNFSLEPTCITEPCLEFIIDADKVMNAAGFETIKMFKHILKKVRIAGIAASTTETSPSVYGDTHNVVKSAKIHDGTNWVTIYEN